MGGAKARRFSLQRESSTGRRSLLTSESAATIGGYAFPDGAGKVSGGFCRYLQCPGGTQVRKIASGRPKPRLRCEHIRGLRHIMVGKGHTMHALLSDGFVRMRRAGVHFDRVDKRAELWDKVEAIGPCDSGKSGTGPQMQDPACGHPGDETANFFGVGHRRDV